MQYVGVVSAENPTFPRELTEDFNQKDYIKSLFTD